MELKLGKIKLLTSDIKKLTSFLSFIFDEAPNVLNDQNVYFNFLGVQFHLVESKSSDSFQNSTICFECESLELLDVFKQKLEFYQYKSDTTCIKPKMLENTLLFTDTDQREWEFFVPKSLERPINKESTLNLTSAPQM